VDNPQAGQGRPLPKKESDLFKSVVKHYEMKQYKKGIKAADTIMRKFPNHGETLCMKGLTMNCQGKKEEAHSLVKKGLMNDMRSHVCWHVYGLLHRSDRNYNEAIKAYKQALRIDPENLQILRDLSLLQIQMRDLDGFAVTRHTILTLKPNQRINWLSFALAKHLTGDLRGAVSVIDIYLGTLEADSPELRRGFESGELALYRNSILAEIPENLTEALEHLDSCESVVVDEGSRMRLRASHLLMLGRYDDARVAYLDLFKRGHGDDYRVHSGYMCSKLKLDRKICEDAMKLRGTDTLATMAALTADQKKELLDAYRDELGRILGTGSEVSSHAFRRIPLTLLDGEGLRCAVDAYCRSGLTKGVPSLGSDLSALFIVEENGRCVRVTDPVDVKSHSVFKMLVELVDGYISSLESVSKFSTSDENGNDEEEQPPSTILWTWYLRALLHELCGEFSEAISLTDKCLAHTPTAVDVYELKARLLAAAGDASGAADTIDIGRELDRQDRYINNRTVEYLLRANRTEEARSRIALFTRHEGDPERNLYDMQCTWYELELASCLARTEKWGKSLKKYMAVVKHFEDFHEDQFDFHSYCIRKVTLRAYMDVLRFENDLWGQPYYGLAAEGIIRNYLYLFDHPSARSLGGHEEPDYSKMTAAERKKAKAIARKKKKKAADKKKKEAEEAEKKRQEVEAAAQNSENGNNNKGKGGGGGSASQHAAAEEDPDGETLIKKDPLEEAKTFVAVLANNAPKRISTWILQYDVSIRRKKLLLALKALVKSKALDAGNDELFTRIVDFAQKGSPSEDSHPIVKELMRSETAALLDGKNLLKFVKDARDDMVADVLTPLPKRVAVAQALVSTGAGNVVDAAALIIDGGLEGRGVSVESCRKAQKCLKEFGGEAGDFLRKWSEQIEQRFPLASFM